MIHFYREIRSGDCCLNVTGSSFEERNLTFSWGKEKIYIQKFYLYLNLTKPTKFLFILGKVCQEREISPPSYFRSVVMRLFPDLKPVDEEEKVSGSSVR